MSKDLESGNSSKSFYDLCVYFSTSFLGHPSAFIPLTAYKRDSCGLGALPSAMFKPTPALLLKQFMELKILCEACKVHIFVVRITVTAYLKIKGEKTGLSDQMDYPQAIGLPPPPQFLTHGNSGPLICQQFGSLQLVCLEW